MDSERNEDVIVRLRKVEGQIRGLQRMIEENRDCSAVINQLCAARRALDKVGFIILTSRIRECAQAGTPSQTAVEETLEMFMTLA